MTNNKWDSVLADLERKGTLSKDLVALLLRTLGDPPKEICEYISAVLTGHKKWRTGNPGAAYNSFRQEKKRAGIKALAEPRIDAYIAEGHSRARSIEIVAVELEEEYSITRSAIDRVMHPRKARKSK